MITEEKDIAKYIVEPQHSIKDAMKIIDENKSGTVFVIDNNQTLMGSLTDGDIRRGFLRGENIESSVTKVMFTNTTFVKEKFVLEEVKRLLLEKQIKVIPVTDDNYRLVSVLTNLQVRQNNHQIENYAILMVGGEGKRLSPLTNDVPKPLLQVGGKPILQIILERLAFHGFKNVILCTMHKAESIEEFCGSGEKFGLSISYFKEEEKLGTIGAVKYLESKLSKPFLVMNGDLLTLVNYKGVLDYHIQNLGDLTVCSKEFSYSVPYGVLEVSGMEIRSVSEKPSYSYRVSAGIYAVNPAVLDYIPKGQYFDITDLMSKVLNDKKRLITFPIGEYWLDIGLPQDYTKANLDFPDHFEES